MQGVGFYEILNNPPPCNGVLGRTKIIENPTFTVKRM